MSQEYPQREGPSACLCWCRTAAWGKLPRRDRGFDPASSAGESVLTSASRATGSESRALMASARELEHEKGTGRQRAFSFALFCLSGSDAVPRVSLFNAAAFDAAGGRLDQRDLMDRLGRGTRVTTRTSAAWIRPLPRRAPRASRRMPSRRRRMARLRRGKQGERPLLTQIAALQPIPQQRDRSARASTRTTTS